MKRFLPVLLLCAAATLRAETNPPTMEQLQRMKLELEVERARLDMERARLDATRARWEAQRAAAAPARAQAAGAATNAPVYIAREVARLYRHGQLAGDLPAGSGVLARPHPQQRGWLVVQYRRTAYEAEAKSFGEAAAMLAEAGRRAAAAKAARDEVQARFDDAQARRWQLEQQITALGTARGPSMLVVPPPVSNPPASNPLPVIVFSGSPDSSQLSRLRNELRETDRELAKLQKQLPPLAQELERAEAALQKVRLQVETVRAAGS